MLNLVLHGLSRAWALPYGALGELVALLLFALRWVAVYRRDLGALEIICKGPLAARLAARGWAAFTLGWTVFYWSDPSGTTRSHELRHVHQAFVLGPLFPIVYLALLPFYGYRNHPLERDARDAEV